jgi:guanosine-3',5'-bis(diphosphate) 3'-pyrophosphohydrolase
MKRSIHLLLAAAAFAAERHRRQRRKDAEATPYINHPLEVARLLAEGGRVRDPEVLAAALLHDVIEDTRTTRRVLARRFGARVAALVVEVTDDKSLKKKVRKRLQIEHAHGLSRAAALIKIADKTANLQDIRRRPPKGWSAARRREYFAHAAAVVEASPIKRHPLLTRFLRVATRRRPGGRRRAASSRLA